MLRFLSMLCPFIDTFSHNCCRVMANLCANFFWETATSQVMNTIVYAIDTDANAIGVS